MEDKEEKESRKKFTRREALKRIALTTGSIGLLASVHSWGAPKSGVGLEDMNKPDQQKVAVYYSWYDRYSRYYSTYYKYISVSYSSYSSTKLYSSYFSLSPSSSRGGGCTRSD